MRPEQEITEIIQRINQGTASSTDQKKLDDWYNSFDDSLSVVHKDSDSSLLKETVWRKISTQIFTSKTSKIRRIYLTGAAAVAILAGVVLYNYKSNTKDLSSGVRLLDEQGNSAFISSTVQEFLDSTKYVELASHSNDLNVRVLKTGAGEFIKVILPDGSKVAMNSNTKIQLKEDFGLKGSRIVYLDGEAFFDVKKNNNQKFIVRTKDQSIEVLGTKFNVKSYADQSETLTALYEGKIQLTKDDYSLMVSPSELVTNDGENLSKVAKDLKNTTMWREMRFSFEDVLVKDVIAQLTNWYGLQLEYIGEIPNQRIAGQLEPEMKLKDVLLVIENLTGGTCELKNNKLLIKFSK
ncbi:FecR family protein [Sphingobacterium bovistauri]|uniref:FecR family protein n=1 Tax=Sphingobacterium bovistauri TaxID=2781959 RepID=A0ABS7Z8U5_9SPHI|nr:FecR family protein [Sphingobacterium bovistauri]MCA5006622.1 FecR family protein [Sphingobacterium bovistauri]